MELYVARDIREVQILVEIVVEQVVFVSLGVDDDRPLAIIFKLQRLRELVIEVGMVTRP